MKKILLPFTRVKHLVDTRAFRDEAQKELLVARIKAKLPLTDDMVVGIWSGLDITVSNYPTVHTGDYFQLRGRTSRLAYEICDIFEALFLLDPRIFKTVEAAMDASRAYDVNDGRMPFFKRDLATQVRQYMKNGTTRSKIRERFVKDGYPGSLIDGLLGSELVSIRRSAAVKAKNLILDQNYTKKEAIALTGALPEYVDKLLGNGQTASDEFRDAMMGKLQSPLNGAINMMPAAFKKLDDGDYTVGQVLSAARYASSKLARSKATFDDYVLKLEERGRVE